MLRDEVGGFIDDCYDFLAAHTSLLFMMAWVILWMVWHCSLHCAAFDRWRGGGKGISLTDRQAPAFVHTENTAVPEFIDN